MPKRMAGAAADSSGELWLNLDGWTRKYFISRNDVGNDGLVDDEAQLEIQGTIVAISPAQKKHLGALIHISLLSAQNYSLEKRTVSAFFGSVTLRGSQRSALAYLPAKVFWELPSVFAEGPKRLCLGWNSMHRGYADLTSLFVGDDEDLEQFATTCLKQPCEADGPLEKTS